LVPSQEQLKGVLPKDYPRPGLDKQRLGQLINLVSDIGLGSPADRAKDVLGRVYEYFLAQFASAGLHLYLRTTVAQSGLGENHS
jgi:type I restriction-modification system DNA methylase subunit